MVSIILKVDFHRRVFGYARLTHLNFNHVNKIEAKYKVLRLVERGSTFTLTCDLSYIASIFKFPFLRIFKCVHA